MKIKSYFEKSIPALFIIIFFFLGLFAYSEFFGPMPFAVTSNVTNKTDVFSVTGEGTLSVQPDIAYVNVGIQKNASTVKQAQTEINETMDKIITGLKSLNISSKDIKTVDYFINPQYDWTSGTQKITGYSASTQLKVKITDLDKINQIIDSATANGANQVENITLDVEDRDAAEETARKEAVEEANAKAKAAAQAAGFKLGRIIGYSESSDDSNLLRPVTYSLKAAGGVLEESTTDTNIQTGSEEIKITVTISYQID